MPAKATGPEQKPDSLAELGKLIQSALERQGASARSIAQRAGIGASHLSKVLKAKRSLRKAKLLILADLLGLDREKVVRLAGFGRLQEPPVDLGRVTLLRTLDKFVLNVVVTPRFYDAAIFMWMFNHQPLAEVGVQCQLRRTEWSNVPAELASYTYSLGFHSDTPALFRLARWSHLCLDKGNALIGRLGGPAHEKEPLAWLTEQAKKRGRRLLLVASDHSSVDWLRAVTGLGDQFDPQVIPNPDLALESFRAGAGDLFLAALPQRLALRGGEFKELVAYGKAFPRFYSLRSLICSQAMLVGKRPLLHAVEALWYDTCRRLRADGAFRTLVFDEILDSLERHGIEKNRLVREDFEALFTPAGRDFEIFPETPAQLWEETSQLSGI